MFIASLPVIRSESSWRGLSGTSPTMTASGSLFAWLGCIVTRSGGSSRGKKLRQWANGLRGRSVRLNCPQMVQPFSHGLLQIVARPPECGIAAGEKSVVFALQGAPGARAVGGRLPNRFGVQGVDLAVKIGEFRIGADRLLDRAFGG